METVEFLKAYIRQYRDNPPSSLREYCRQFTLISQKATEAGNLDNRKQGYWFVKGLPLKYQKHTMAETEADPDRQKSFNFYQLLRAVELRIMATENAEQMDVLLEEDALNVQLIQELQQ